MASFDWPPSGAGGGGGPSAVGGSVIADGEQSLDITFAEPFESTDYRVVLSLVNTVDAAEDLIFVSYVITAKTMAGFTVAFNAPLTSDYSLDYIAVGDTP